MKNYSKTLYLLRESSFSRDSLFVSELVEEVKGLLTESSELLERKMKQIDDSEIETFEQQITELRFMRSKLLEILKMDDE
jgi:regulator of sirC expression with transglutaminase-like and TPR domain